jgi:hypothetical protein
MAHVAVAVTGGMVCGGFVAERCGQVGQVVAAALALGGEVVHGEGGVVEVLHRQGRGDEGGAGGAAGDPDVDGGVDRQVDDVVGREAQPLLFLLVDRDAVAVDVHGEPGQGAGVLQLAHAEDRDRLEQRAHARADELVADLGRVLPGKAGLEAGGAALGEHRCDRRCEHVVGLVDIERDPPAALLGQGRRPARGLVRQRRLRALHHGRARAVAWWGQLSHRAPHMGDPERPAEANWSACGRAASPRAPMSAGSATRPMIASCHLMPHESRPAPAAM